MENYNFGGISLWEDLKYWWQNNFQEQPIYGNKDFIGAPSPEEYWKTTLTGKALLGLVAFYLYNKISKK